MKICTHCGEPGTFSKNKLTRDGLASWCNRCNAATEKQRRRNRNPLEKSRLDFKKNLQGWDLTVEEFAWMLHRAGFRCENPGCRKLLNLDNRDWAIDHDHSCCSGGRGCSNCIRGLLCRGCNSALGHIGENEKRIVGLSSYLSAKAPKEQPALTLASISTVGNSPDLLHQELSFN